MRDVESRMILGLGPEELMAEGHHELILGRLGGSGCWGAGQGLTPGCKSWRGC